ncbi:MAG: flagellar protein FlaG [Bacillota bacterium]
MKVDGVDPVQLNKVHDFTQKTVVQESQRQDPKQKQQERVLGREQPVGEWDGSRIEELDEALRKMNQTAETFNVSLRFRVHEETERIMVQVINRDSKEVIREIPPERVLNMVAQIQNMIGLFVDFRR